MGHVSNTSRRSFLKSSAAIGAVGIAGCLGDSGDVTVQIGISGGSWGEWVTEFFFEPWSEETGYDYNVDFLDGAALEAELFANRNDPVKDLAHLSDGDAIRLGAEGIIEPIEGRLDNLDQVGEAFKNDYLAGKVATPFGIGYNTDATDLEVSSWNHLLESEFEGRVAIPAWGWMGATWLYVINDALGGTESNVEPGLNYVEQVIHENDGLIMDTTDHGLRMFETEEIFIAPYWSARTDQVRQGSDVNTRFVYPEEGALLTFYNMGLVSGRPEENLEAAASLLDYTLEAEGQAQFSSNIGYPPPNLNAVAMLDGEAVESIPSLQITQEDMESMAQIDIDWLEVSKHREEHADAWRRIVTS